MFRARRLVGRAIIAALCVIATSAGERRILLATIPPFAASEYHSAKDEATRVQANRWIRANWAGVDVIDLDLILGDPGNRSRLRLAFDSGDGFIRMRLAPPPSPRPSPRWFDRASVGA